MSPLRTRVLGFAAAVLAVGALSACGGGGGKAASVSTPAAPAATSGTSGAAGTTPQPEANAPAQGATTAPGHSANANAAPGGADDQTLNQIDNELSNIDASLATSDSAAAQETQ